MTIQNYELRKIISQEIKNQDFDFLAVGVIDFSERNYMSFQSHRFSPQMTHYRWVFDLASLTKPLTLGLSYLKYPDLFSKEMVLLLEHRAGLPSWGRLSQYNWKEQLFSYPITPSEISYSDFSALRLMLELERKVGKPFQYIVSDILTEKVSYWNNIKYDKKKCYFPPTGFRNFKKIQGDVNDDNCFVIKDNCSHAGLFGSIEGVCESLLYIDQKYHLLSEMKKKFLTHNSKRRFKGGWDTVQNLDTTLAGKGATLSTFGHLGHTGTSIWIEITRKKGHVILTNATQNHTDKTGLNKLRRTIGEFIWKNF